MRRAIATLAVLCLTLSGCGGAAVNSTSSPPAAAGKFVLTSPAFADKTPIPSEFSCKGRNVPPPLRWENVPTGTESLALVVDDPDAPAGRYVHWVVTAIPPATTAIREDVLPQRATVSLNAAGKSECFGPCPPVGTGGHHYRFQLYAVSKPLTVAPTTSAAEATRVIADAAIADARTVGLFSS